MTFISAMWGKPPCWYWLLSRLLSGKYTPKVTVFAALSTDAPKDSYMTVFLLSSSGAPANVPGPETVERDLLVHGLSCRNRGSQAVTRVALLDRRHVTPEVPAGFGKRLKLVLVF